MNRWPSAAGAACAAALAVGFASPPQTRREAAVTFTKDVAPIVFGACAPCHRPEGAAPFSLLTYQDARSHAAEIVAATRDRIMPPWKPEPGYGRFADERRLTGDQIATIARWFEGGAVEGDPGQLPPAPAPRGRWQLGEPDLVLEIDPYVLRPSGDDVYRNFVLPIATTGTRHIRAWEFLPGSRAIHHATMELDSTRSSRQLDDRDPQPGYEGLIPHTAMSPDGYFLGWLPGHTPYIAPPGMAWPLPAGSDLVMMLHLRPRGTEETVRASLGLYFSSAPPTVSPTLIRLTRQNMDIPPGEKRYVVTDSFALDVDVDVFTIQPHAHHLAKDVRSFATLPDGMRKWLIYIRQWDFDWQGVFRYARPEFLPAGSTITMEYTYDNSAENPHNPHVPPHRVTYGQRTMDEMAELWLQVVPRRASDRERLAAAVRRKIVREEIVGIEKRLETDPDNAPLHDDVALLHAESGRLDRTAAHFAETVRLTPDSAAARYNLGNALFRVGRRAEAIDQLRKAVALRPDYALAHDGLGVALYAAGQVDEAIEHYRTAISLDPGNAEAQYHLTIALRGPGR